MGEAEEEAERSDGWCERSRDSAVKEPACDVKAEEEEEEEEGNDVK